MLPPIPSADLARNPATAGDLDSDLPVRLAAGVAGGLLIGLWRRRERRSAAFGVAGALLAGYALRRAARAGLIAAGLDRRCVSLRLALDVARPVREVFTFFRDFENFQQLLGGLQSVTDFQDGRSHWEVRDGHGGVIAWDAVVTKYLPNSVIAWQSVPGSLVRSSGTVRFSPRPDGRTHLDIVLEYRPLHASLGEAARALITPRPAAQIEAELSRMPVVVENVLDSASAEAPAENASAD
jgi:uncharacterized membrane protein